MMINGVPFDGSSFRIAWVRSRLRAGEKVLNIGVGNQLYGFESVYENIVLFDIDRYCYRQFVQGDAHHLPFKEGSFDTVLIADVLEHVVDPVQVCKEATRVGRRLMLSIFEEWRLGGEGQHIESGQAAYQGGSDPDVISQVPEEKISHKPHIWQYTDKMIKDLIWSTGWKIIEFSKEPECIHQGHMWWNWFVILERPEIWPANIYPGDPVNHFPPAMLEQIMGQKAIKP